MSFVGSNGLAEYLRYQSYIDDSHNINLLPKVAKLTTKLQPRLFSLLTMPAPCAVVHLRSVLVNGVYFMLNVQGA